MRRTKLLTAAALLAALLCLTGCQDTDSAKPEPAATAAMPELTAAPATEPPTGPTAAPELTATPGIYGGTVLFYNPNGGSFYHLDQNCSRVGDKYLPLMGHFTYDQLNEGRYQVLKPWRTAQA